MQSCGVILMVITCTDENCTSLFCILSNISELIDVSSTSYRNQEEAGLCYETERESDLPDESGRER